MWTLDLSNGLPSHPRAPWLTVEAFVRRRGLRLRFSRGRPLRRRRARARRATFSVRAAISDESPPCRGGSPSRMSPRRPMLRSAGHGSEEKNEYGRPWHRGGLCIGGRSARGVQRPDGLLRGRRDGQRDGRRRQRLGERQQRRREHQLVIRGSGRMQRLVLGCRGLHGLRDASRRFRQLVLREPHLLRVEHVGVPFRQQQRRREQQRSREQQQRRSAVRTDRAGVLRGGRRGRSVRDRAHVSRQRHVPVTAGVSA